MKPWEFHFFERNLFLLILLHATEVEHGRLLKFAVTTGNCTKLIVAHRAKAFDKHNLYWEFGYLSICIEDGWMLFPESVRKYFKIEEQWQSAYNFATQYESLSTDDLLEYVHYKAERVWVFLLILETALCHEQDWYRGAFRNLEQKGPALFNIEKYVQERKESVVKESLQKFAGQFIGENYTGLVIDKLKDFESGKEFKKMARGIKRDYAKYCRKSNVLHTAKKNMKKHYNTRE